MTTNDKYIEIPWGKAEKGDILMHPDGWKLPIESVDNSEWAPTPSIRTALHPTEQSFAPVWYERQGYRPHRKLPALPERPGLYVSEGDPNPDVQHTYRRFEGGTWESDRDGTWSWIALHEVPADLVPLVTMPTLEQVTNALPWDFPEERYEEVMDALRSIFEQQGEE